jgi:hypothetical protein
VARRASLGPGTPDAAGPIFGWRVWRVSRLGPALRLRSVLRDDVWEAGAELLAACKSGHEAPAEDCSCGVYAVRERAAAARYLVGRNDAADVDRVIGLVALWGWVFIADGGWRAARAYPARLLVSDDSVAAALADYGVPVERVRANAR